MMKRMAAYSNKAASMKKAHDIIQLDIDVDDLLFGDFAKIPIIRFIAVSVKMIRSAILPGIASFGIT